MTEYDPADDARKSYDVAIEAKRQRGDTHWPEQLSPQNSEKSLMTDTPIDFIAEAITDSLGPRCPEHSDGCPSCEAWAQYDRLKNTADLYEMQSRAPEIDILDLREVDSGEPMGYYARGHFDRWTFARAVNVYTGAHYFHDDRHVPEGLPDYVRHEWWRTVPVSGEPGTSQFVTAEPKSRGAFPVTVTTVIEDRQRKRTQQLIDEHNKGLRTGFANGLNWALRMLDSINPDAGAELLAAYRAKDGQK